MCASPTIAEVRATALDVPLLEPFAIALSTLTEVNNVLVRITLSDGTVGLGEAAPWQELTGETQESVLAAVETARGLLEARDASAWRPLVSDLRVALPGDTSARAGLTSALLDAFARTRGMSLRDFFGGAEDRLETDLTIPIVPAARAEERAGEIAQAGFRLIKVKVGNDLEEDLARLRAIHRAAPAAGLVVDANQGYTPDAACAFLAEAASLPLALFEQPVAKADLEGMRAVREASPVPVAADESAASPEDALRVVAAGAADILNIKLMKCGGLVEALEIAAIARAAGVGLMIGGMLETRLGMGTSARLAAGLGGFAFIDLDTHLLLAEDPFEGGFRQEGPVLHLDGDPGHGVRPRTGP